MNNEKNVKKLKKSLKKLVEISINLRVFSDRLFERREPREGWHRCVDGVGGWATIEWGGGKSARGAGVREIMGG